MTQEEVARAAGCSTSYVGLVEQGRRGQRPSRDIALRLAGAVGMNAKEVDNFLRVAGHLRPGESIFDPQELDVVSEIGRDPWLSASSKGVLISVYASLSCLQNPDDESEVRTQVMDKPVELGTNVVGHVHHEELPPKGSPGKRGFARAPTSSVMTVRQVADELQVSEKTVERLIWEKSLGSVKVGRRRFVRPTQLQEFLDHRALVERKLR